ncbi:uncharacterized protein MONOS_17644 [Monocercomonoides exilis]|uniref:uncharacterized protein n=1 Tax=Monocercomonoides exilis TaxID=2049356 RepID=UPI003559BECD|nr:hypothetical protein MONOS_17644 [Monocercomonoides exilis]
MSGWKRLLLSSKENRWNGRCAALGKQGSSNRHSKTPQKTAYSDGFGFAKIGAIQRNAGDRIEARGIGGASAREYGKGISLHIEYPFVLGFCAILWPRRPRVMQCELARPGSDNRLLVAGGLQGKPLAVASLSKDAEAHGSATLSLRIACSAKMRPRGAKYVRCANK